MVLKLVARFCKVLLSKEATVGGVHDDFKAVQAEFRKSSQAREQLHYCETITFSIFPTVNFDGSVPDQIRKILRS